MDLARPYNALCPTFDADVLVVLEAAEEPLSQGEILRRAGLGAPRGVNYVLQRMVVQGLVLEEERGRYSLNRDHLAAGAVAQLAGMRDELARRIEAAVAGWDVQPGEVSLAGDRGPGDGKVQSEVELLVVRPAGIAADDPRWRAQLDALADEVRRWTGNPIAISESSL